MGEPFTVREDADAAEIERSRLLLESRLKTLETRARDMLSSRPKPSP
jgi:hypothetical protein